MYVLWAKTKNGTWIKIKSGDFIKHLKQESTMRIRLGYETMILERNKIPEQRENKNVR